MQAFIYHTAWREKFYYAVLQEDNISASIAYQWFITFPPGAEKNEGFSNLYTEMTSLRISKREASQFLREKRENTRGHLEEGSLFSNNDNLGS